MPAVNGDLLRKSRLSKGWTLQAVADKCAELGQPIDQSNLSKAERGLAGFSPRPLAVLAKALDRSVDELLAPRSGNGRDGDAA